MTPVFLSSCSVTVITRGDWLCVTVKIATTGTLLRSLRQGGGLWCVDRVEGVHHGFVESGTHLLRVVGFVMGGHEPSLKSPGKGLRGIIDKSCVVGYRERWC